MRFWFLTIVLAIALGCNRPSESNTGNIFRYNESTGIASLDPAFAKNQSVMWPVHQLFSTLVEVDENMQIKPLLAKHWEISEDGLTYIFHIRHGVKFHQNTVFKTEQERLLKASDIVFSLSRIIDASVASPGAWIFSNRLDSLAPFSAPNDSTFVLKLAVPFSPVLGILSMQYCSVISEKAARHNSSAIRSNPVGTGPFSLVKWEEGQALIMRKNPDYFETDMDGIKLPYLDGIAVSFYDSKSTEFLEFRQQRLDFLNDVDPSFKDELLTKTGQLKTYWQDKINIKTAPYLNTEYLGILSDSSAGLLKNSPLRKKPVRQALAHAIDRKKMILYLRNSIGTPAFGGFVPAGLPGHDDTETLGLKYDPELAKTLLAEAGYNKQNPMPEIVLQTIPTYSNLAGFIAADVAKSGFKIKVNVVQKSLLLEQTSKSNVLFFRGSWIADYPDAENYLSVFYSKNPAPPNYTRFTNRAYDALYEAINKETDAREKLRYVRCADSIAVADAFVIPLWYDKVLHFSQKNIFNFSPNSLNMLELRKVKIER